MLGLLTIKSNLDRILGKLKNTGEASRRKNNNISSREPTADDGAV